MSATEGGWGDRSKAPLEARARQLAFDQSLASCGAAVIAFIGVCHEAVGQTLFPWAPEMLGPVGWHALGIFAIAGGLIALLGTLRLAPIPVTALAVLAMLLGLAIGIFTAVVHRQFHMFAFAAVIAAGTTAHFHGRAVAVRSEPLAP